MLEEYFRWKEAHLVPLLATPAGAYLDELAVELHAQGFRSWRLRGRVVGAAHFSLWNRKKRRSSPEWKTLNLTDISTIYS